MILRTNSQLKTASWVYSNKLLSVRCSNNASFLRCFLVACNVQTSEGLRFFSTEILGASLLKGSWILQHLCSYKCFSVLAFCGADVMCFFLFIISSGFSSLDSTDNFAPVAKMALLPSRLITLITGILTLSCR